MSVKKIKECFAFDKKFREILHFSRREPKLRQLFEIFSVREILSIVEDVRSIFLVAVISVFYSKHEKRAFVDCLCGHLFTHDRRNAA